MNDLLDLKRIELVPSEGYYDENASTFRKFGDNQNCFDIVKALYNEIHEAQQSVKGDFITLGSALFELEEGQYYIYVLDHASKSGYVSFYKFCSDCFGFKKRTVARLILVYKTYFLNASEDEKERYGKYSFRQLVEMVNLRDYRYRVNETVSTRDIKRLADLYRDYAPRPEDTISHDLEIWKEWHKDDLKKKSDKKETLFFVPKRSVSAPPADEAAESNYDAEEGSATSTPSNGLTYDDIRRGLCGNLDKLVALSGAWKKAADAFKEALDTKTPNKIVTRKDEAEAVKAVFNDPHLPKKLPRAEKVMLNNDTERKTFIKSAKDWPLWFEIPEFDMKIRRKDFINGDYIIALVYNEYYDFSAEPDRPYEVIEYHLVSSHRKKFGKNEECETSLLKYLKANRKNI